MDEGRFLEELKKGFGDGPLTLGVVCTKCNSQFAVANDAIVMAMLTEVSFLEFMRYVGSSKCSACNEEARE